MSAASNLVRRDTNGKPDAFVYDLRSGKLRRVSVNSRGRQSSGTVSEVVVNGLCTRRREVKKSPPGRRRG